MADNNILVVPTQADFDKNSGVIAIVDHGEWEIYKPDAHPVLYEIPNAIFARRKSDTLDWYNFAQNSSNFGKASLICTVQYVNTRWVVQGVFTDRSMVFPANMRVIEIQNYKGSLDKVHQNWEQQTYDPATRTIFPVQVDLKQVAANQKYLTETGGIIIDGYPVATDRQSQSMMTSTVLSLQLKPDTVVNWKGPDGKFAVLPNQFIIGMAILTMQHVASCFFTESKVVELIDAGTITTPEQIVDYFKANVNLVISTKTA